MERDPSRVRQNLLPVGKLADDPRHDVALRACLPNIRVLNSEDSLMTRMGVISDEFWAAVESVMPVG